MKVYVFTGPTISASDASHELDAVYLPPAAAGDVYRASLTRPQAIGIIDGYFQSTPTVRHKEILWAMSNGIHVFGSASMGALRAAELAAFGMEGVGTIFRQYRDGILEDDDEVAVAHGPAEVAFMAGSEAMVNIRQTLHQAQRTGIISGEAAKMLEKIAKNLFYPDRNYAAVVHRALEEGVPATELEQFQQWWPNGHVNQKRNDAVEMLRLMRACLAENLPPKRVSYSFEYTSMWETARRLAGDLFNAGAEHDILELEWLLNELRLKGTSYDRNKLLAVERYLAIRESYRLGVHITERARDQTASLFREDRNLTDDKHLSRWKQENRLSDSEFDSLISDEARLRWFHRRARYLSFCYLAEQLRVSGDYAHLSRRALTKQHVLESFGLTNPSLSDTGLTDSELMQWYFEKVLYRSVPQNIRKYSQELDFANPDAFHRAVIKEYLFRQLSTNAQRKESA